MKIPGFEAEASLREMKESYALAVGHAAENGMVVPQQLHGPCWPGCMHCDWLGCYCGPCLKRAYV